MKLVVGRENEERQTDRQRQWGWGWEHEVSWSVLKWLLKMTQEENAK